METKEIILKEMAKWYVENRRPMTEKAMEEIAQRLNVSEEDIKKERALMQMEEEWRQEELEKEEREKFDSLEL
jgi:hypothetical protein